MSLRFQKIIACFMLLLVFALMPISFCLNECLREASMVTCDQEEGESKIFAVKHQIPQSSSGNHSKPAQRVPGFHCPCALPMPPEHAQYSPVIAISSLEFFEPYQAVPEVFLPKFVPPA